ncbi:NEK protein kinase [Microbotryum lychnidis-dioicae p1A1 Lamole]|uniref:non-specific serine/threonine protein kinase n=1 Tax=Microbotryum lychnidis-dioicae (strain p1A1 Lamole / MvSl-1064) TaxID=683840 RepID=U5H6R7_USTV1|nr:NEK protein kinase [Microbotryum lychnidis-dioicae p1A1 Lamole]|eukprot:KDE06769.1 NEK protein kinase [Microbotryum lychnidis-dioicae p1A1 Lamole]
MASTEPMARPPAQRRKTLVGDHPLCTSASMEEIYEAGDVIGTGSFGIIRKVTRKVDGAVLARKELNYGRMDERDLKQLTEEVNILEQLGSNDNIVRYYERFVDKPNSMLYILMEYCEGGDLAGVIHRCRKTGTYLSEDVVWAYLTQITLALYDCHTEVDTRGRRKQIILHRDIKPENVFLDKENNLKLGDFGLSKAMAQAAMTQTYVGTPYYMSPELINGQPYDVKSDIWALGCLIYELCAGHPPFHEARTQPELAVMIREGKIPDLPKPYTAHLGQVVKAMLKQSPKHRPNTSQIKALDNVKLQIRALELRKATKELRMRDHQIGLREADILAREAAVLQREKNVLHREAMARQAAEQIKEGEMALAARIAAANQAAQQTNGGCDDDLSNERENQRPVGGIEPEVFKRVASRPSLVPRRPLDERRASGIAFPRVSSVSSLMSLDETPIKVTANSVTRRRLASKSMHNLASAAGYASSVNSTPSRPASSASNGSSSSMAPSPRIGQNEFLSARRSQTAVSPSRGASLSRSSHERASTLTIPTSPCPAPYSGSTIPPVPQSPKRAHIAPAATNASGRHSNPCEDDGDVPSPFLKKADPSRFPLPPPPAAATGRTSATVSGRGPGRALGAGASRASLGGKPVSMASKLLSARAQAQAGVDEVGRRLSGLTAGRA